jgi:hypothetical protein
MFTFGKSVLLVASLIAGCIVPTQAATLSLTANQTIYNPGNTVDLSAMIFPMDDDKVLSDIYLAVVMPDNSLLALDRNKAWKTSLSPIISATPIASINAPNFYSLPLPANQVEGKYTFYLVAVPTGKNPLDRSAWLGYSIAPITVAIPANDLRLKSRTQAAIEADGFFWKVFTSGDYDSIPALLNALTGAYLADPTDAKTAAHLGWTHAWHLSESKRLSAVPPTITDEAVIARKFFDQAVRFDPTDARYLGIQGGMMIAEAGIHRDAELFDKGYAVMQQASLAFPEFNLFGDGFTLSRQPASSPYFKSGLEKQWINTDICIGAKIDRINPDMKPYMHLATTIGPKRVCWNLPQLAPHNFEGFFLNFGDMLVKAGDWQTAQKIYVQAKYVTDYATWSYRNILEQRITEAQSNVAAFNADPNSPQFKPVMAQSALACTGCHQN